MPLLSVIIPTHNRAHCAISAIKSTLSISDDIQVVVSDSSDIDLITPEFKDWNDPKRLKFVRHNEPISVVDNFNSALQAADGEYLLFIGDDDFVSSEVVSLAQWAKANDVDSLKFSFPALYYWPNFKHATRGDVYAGTLHIAPFTGKISAHNAQDALTYALNNFGGGVFEMPRAYAGMLSSTLAKKIIGKYGSLFGGVSPDIYSSALISTEASNCMHIDFPIIIPGASGQSTTGQSAVGGHRGELRANPHISAFKNLIWDDRIPEFYSVPTVWSFSLLKAVEEIAKQNENRVITPNFGRLILKCLAYHPDEMENTLVSFRILREKYGSAFILWQLTSALFSEFAWGIGRIKNRIVARYIKQNIYVADNLNTTFDANNHLHDYLLSHTQKINL